MDNCNGICANERDLCCLSTLKQEQPWAKWGKKEKQNKIEFAAHTREKINGSSHWVVFTFQLVVSYFPWGSPEDNWGRNGLQMLVTPLSYGPLGAHSGFVTRLHHASEDLTDDLWHVLQLLPCTPYTMWWHKTQFNLVTLICYSQFNHPNTENCSLPHHTIWNHL